MVLGLPLLSGNWECPANPVSRCENGSGAMVDTLARMQQSLEAAGVVFCFSSNWVRFAKTGQLGGSSKDTQLLVVDTTIGCAPLDGLILFLE